MVKNLPAMQETQVQTPWRGEWLLTPVFLPGEYHGQRSLAGYSLWRHRVKHDRATNTFLFWETDQPSTFQRNWGTLGNLESPRLTGSRTCIQTQSVASGASICPWKADSRSCVPASVLVSFLTTCEDRTVWVRPTDEDLLKYIFYSLQTSFIYTHPSVLSW